MGDDRGTDENAVLSNADLEQYRQRCPERERLQEDLEKRYSELIYFRDCIPAVTQRLPLAVPNVAKVLRKRWLS